MSYILSPTAKIFPCRRLALKHMIEQNMGEDEVTKIFLFLVTKWSPHPPFFLFINFSPG